MSKLMWVLGILLAAAGIALGLMAVLSPGRMDVWGIKLDTAAILFVGGILSLGLGGVIDAQRSSRRVTANRELEVSVAPVIAVVEAEPPMQIPTGFGRKAAGVTTAVAATAASLAEAPKSSVADTIAALDEARADIKKALGGIESVSTPENHAEPVYAEVPPPAVAAAAEEELINADPNLYVVEEKIIRGRPARILSDDTVEAETDEGWMRFENLEHLNEYLDSTEEPDA